MSSFVYYKFKSQKEPTRVTIDGPHTDVWTLKREIMLSSRLGDGTDIDLKIYKENTDEEYTDDTEIIPKDSTVLARRLPAAAPGKGRAARYVSGKPPISAKSMAPSKSAASINITENMTEEERLKAMLKMTDNQWQQKQEEMSHEQRIAIAGRLPQKKANIPEGEPPPTYTCYRCNQKGHWIQACPTNNDPNFDGKPRVKRTTGIPRSMLKKVDKDDLDKLDEQTRQNIMINAEGEYVLAQTDEKAWRKFQEQVRANEAAQTSTQNANKELQNRGLECSIDKRLFVDPMKTPCCGKTYCHDCIENALLENDLECPGCQTPNVSLEGLEPDEDMKQKIREYEDDKKQMASDNVSAAASPKAVDGNSSRPQSRNGSKSPASVAGKKRSADEATSESPSSSRLAAPAMKRQKSGESDSPTQSEDNDTNNATETASTAEADFTNMMPPDMSAMFAQMQNASTNANNLNMPFNPAMMMPFMNPMMMNNPMMMQNMQGMMNMNGMPNMNMPFNNFNNPNSMNGNGPGGNNHYNNTNNAHGGRGNWRGGKKFNNFNRQTQNSPSPVPGPDVPNAPKGPKAMQTQGQQIPSGPKFANQQRPQGRDEDNAYMRAPVNPGRARGRNNGFGGGGRQRVAEYREL